MNVWEQNILYRRRDDDTWVKAAPIEEQRIRTQSMTGELILSVFIAPTPLPLTTRSPRMHQTGCCSSLYHRLTAVTKLPACVLPVPLADFGRHLRPMGTSINEPSQR